MGMAATVLEVTDEGFVIESTVTEVEVGLSNIQVTETLENIYAFLPGLSTYILMSPSGELLESDDSQLSSLIEASGQQIDFSPAGVAAPFPVEPVGIGARWTVVATIPQEFVSITQTSTYEFISIDGSVIELAITVEQVMDNVEALGIGLENAETSYQALGSGSLLFDLAMPLPLESDLALDQLIEINGTADGSDVDVVTRNYTTVSVVSEN
jgi:hypothetical protein